MMLKAWIIFSGLVIFIYFDSAMGQDDVISDIHECRALQNNEKRLSCYDQLAARTALPNFFGRRTMTTDHFHIEKPTRLRFQSEGVIFVLYVKDSNDAVVQNLHIGGAGEGSYIIESAGEYYLEINASGSWKIWLEPL